MFDLMKIRYFLLFGFITLIIVIFGSFIIFGEAFIEDETLFTLIFSYTILGAFPLLWFWIQFKKQKGKFPDELYVKDVGQSIPALLGLTLTLIIFSLGSFWLTCFLLAPISPGYVEWLLQDVELFPDHTFLFFLTAIYISLIGPIVEEFIFRGLLLNRLATKFNMMVGIFITNIIFAVFHSDILGAFMFGFILSILYLKSGNLLLPIIVHVLNNSYVTILTIIDPPLPDFLSETTMEQLSEQIIPNIIMLAISIPILIIYIKKNKRVF